MGYLARRGRLTNPAVPIPKNPKGWMNGRKIAELHRFYDLENHMKTKMTLENFPFLMGHTKYWVVIFSNIFKCSPRSWREMMQFDNVFQVGWFNQQLINTSSLHGWFLQPVMVGFFTSSNVSPGVGTARLGEATIVGGLSRRKNVLHKLIARFLCPYLFVHIIYAVYTNIIYDILCLYIVGCIYPMLIGQFIPCLYQYVYRILPCTFEVSQ